MISSTMLEGFFPLRVCMSDCKIAYQKAQRDLFWEMEEARRKKEGKREEKREKKIRGLKKWKQYYREGNIS